MNPLTLTLLLIMIIIIVLLFMRVSIEAHYFETLSLQIKFLCFKINLKNMVKKKEKSAPKAKEDNTAQEAQKNAKQSTAAARFVLDAVGTFRRALKRRVVLSNVSIEVAIGTSDAAQTAILTGVISGAAYEACAVLGRFLTVYKPYVCVTPHFEREVLKYRLSGIISSRLAHIIAIGIMVGIKYLKYKGGNKNERTSD